MSRIAISLTVNGTPTEVLAEPREQLADLLRGSLLLTGTHLGCEHGVCGACTVEIDGVPVRSCITRIADVGDQEITTIEGLSPDGTHPVQRAWTQHNVPQCGYCQPGQIMQAAALLKETPKPTDQQITDAMSGNICRCGTYQRIRTAIKDAAGLGA